MSDHDRMRGSTVLVTGGIGLAAASGLAGLGARVGIVGRSAGRGTEVTATVLHPGVVRAAFGREDAGRFRRLMFALVTPFMKTPEQGAATPIHLASSPGVAGVTGGYFANRRPKRSSPASYDRDLARRLWEVSSALTGTGHQRNGPVGTKEQA